jgi:hypothetical protein
MASTTLIRHRLGKTRSIRVIDHIKNSEIPGWELALDRLIGELVCAFFVAMAVMWVVASIAGRFS